MLHDLINHFNKISLNAENPKLFLYGISVIYITVLSLVLSVLYKFAEHKKQNIQLEQEIKTPLNTMLMAVIIASYFPLWLRSLGQFPLSLPLQYIYWGLGAFLCVFGIFWHIWAKINIGVFWSDTIEVKRNHKLIKTGAYALARHPMYGSMMLWSIGANLMMFSWSGMLVAWMVFLPVLYLRAQQEEKALAAAIPDYCFYQQNTPLFFPRLAGISAVFWRIAVLCLYIYSLWIGLDFGSILFLSMLHLIMGYSLSPAKVAFSYRSKSGMMIVIYMLSLIWAPLNYLQYLVVLMFIYGLRWNCPCMLVYEKYHRCPCFALLGRCFLKK